MVNKLFLLDIELDTEYIKSINQSQKLGIALGIFALVFPVIFFSIAKTNIVWKYILLFLGVILFCICYVKTRPYVSAKTLVNYFRMRVYADKIEFVGENENLLIIPYADIKRYISGRIKSESLPSVMNCFIQIKTQKNSFRFVDIYFKDQGYAKKSFEVIKNRIGLP